ncbi:MAG TPA: hypothetical protein VE967_05000 [Gemmatimonadaceae bacterium]|nr:hypothetical protein [Gemmatimonadaceae bacterium]
MIRIRFAVLASASLVATPALAQKPIPVRTTTLVAASDSGFFRDITDIRHNDNGSVLVNDTLQRKIILLDQALKKATTVIDNGTSTMKYGTSSGRLIADRTGLTFYLAPGGQVLTPISNDGKLARNFEIPHAARVYEFANPAYGTPMMPAGGGFMFRGSRNPRPNAVQDSAPVLYAGTQARIMDTIALISLPSLISMKPQNKPGVHSILPAADEWTDIVDGTVAVIRQRDYRVDWYFSAGTNTSSGALPMEWRPITDADKPKALQDLRDAFPNAKVDAADLPEFFPAVRPGSTKADADNNVWTLPYSSKIETGYVYDLINKVRGLDERVQLPPGRVLVGFGRPKTNIIYVSYVAGPGDVRLERMKINR